MDTKGILTVEQKQPEKVSKVAKIKEYLKLRLMDFFTAVFFFGVAFILYIKGDVDFSQVPTYSFVAEKQLPIAVIHMTGWGCVVLGVLAVAKAVLQTIVGCAMLVFGGSIHNNIVQPLEPKTEQVSGSIKQLNTKTHWVLMSVLILQLIMVMVFLLKVL